MQEIDIPRYIDSQPQFLWWELDEFGLVMGLIGVGILTKTLTWMLLVVIPSAIWLLRRSKNNSLEGTLHHILCYTGVLSLNKEFPNSLQEEFFL